MTTEPAERGTTAPSMPRARGCRLDYGFDLAPRAGVRGLRGRRRLKRLRKEMRSLTLADSRRFE